MQINLTPDVSLPIILLIFAANYFVVRKFFLEPVDEILMWREHEVKGAEKLYETSVTRFNDAVAEMESKLHEAKREGSQLREERRAEAGRFRAELVDKTRKEAEALVTSAGEKITGEVSTARERIKSESESLARLAAERILGRAL